MSRIVRIEVGRFDYVMAGAFRFFAPDPDGKTRRPSVLVRLTDENGIQGWGQSVPVPSWSDETVESVETTLRNYLAPAILGADPANLADIHARMERAIRPTFTIGQPLCKAAIDLACYDLWGKQTGQCVSQLLGGAKTKQIELSWTIQAPDMNEVERQLDQARALGYASFNVKVGYPQTLEYDLELVRKVCAFEPNGFHWIDANTSYAVDNALALAPKFADAGMRAWESPLPPHRLRGYQALKKQGAIPIFMDEGIITPNEVAEFIALGMFDGITMKVARCAGLWHASRIVELLQHHNLKMLASGLCDPDLSFIASIHLFACAGIAAPAGLNGPQYLEQRGVTDDACRAHNNLVDVPTLPGLGLSLDARAESALMIAKEL